MNLRTTALAAGVAAALGFAGNAPAVTVETVMSGLDNPRGLAFAPNGALYVTEAGTGGPPNWPHANNCALNSTTNETRCYGDTGRVRRLRPGETEPEIVADRLPSHATWNTANFPNGGSAAGPNRISFQGTGGAYITLGLGGNAAFAARLGSGGLLMGSVIHMATSGRWRMVADILDHEESHNPEPSAVDTNPFGIATTSSVRYVADAGGNSLLAAYANGRVETLAVFPPRAGPMDSVPTGVALGPDGALYVGELTGFPFPQGAARIHRVVPGQPSEVFLEGFQTIMDLAFDDGGNLYVLEHSAGAFPPPPPFKPNTGKLTKIGPAPTHERTVLKADLNRPTALAIGPDGAIYVTNNGVVPGTGQVLKITP